MPTKIPATVVTGFLGAGKTTLIRHMLQNAQGKKIALIINEFGEMTLSSCPTDASAAPWQMTLSQPWNSFWHARTNLITS